MNPIGLNILAQFVDDRNGLIDWITKAQPAACVVMDDIGLAQSIRSSSPQTLVIHRAFNKNDNNWHNTMTPEDWLAAHTPFATNGIVLQCFNEPSPGDVAPFLSWLLKVMTLATQQNIRLALPAFAVGNPPDHNLVINGGFDDLLRALAGSPHYFMLHEYFKDDPVNESPWLSGRFKFWMDRADTLGIERPKIILGEHGRDQGGGHNDGWLAQGWSEDDYLRRLKQAQSLYEQYNIPVCIFSYGDGAGGDWEKFDIEHSPGLKDKLIQYGIDHPLKAGLQPVVHNIIDDHAEEIHEDEHEIIHVDEDCAPAAPGPLFFRVVTRTRIRGAAGLDAVALTPTLEVDDIVEVDPTTCTPKDHYIWWKHSLGWSAERTTKDAPSEEILMERVDVSQSIVLPNGRRVERATLFESTPVTLGETHWLQYFGNTIFAHNLSLDRDPRRRTMYYFAQGLHSGIDYGNDNLPEVHAGVNGIVAGVFRDSAEYAPNYVMVKAGKFLVIYGHIYNIPQDLVKDGVVTPGTKVGEIAPAGAQGSPHLHLELRSSSWILNPLLFMPDAMWQALTTKFPDFNNHFYSDASWRQWLTPLDQPVLKLSRKEDAVLIGPLAVSG